MSFRYICAVAKGNFLRVRFQRLLLSDAFLTPALRAYTSIPLVRSISLLVEAMLQLDVGDGGAFPT